jgi:hypothetical protein
MCYLQGHDTTAMAISWALYFLGIHTDIQVIEVTIYSSYYYLFYLMKGFFRRRIDSLRGRVRGDLLWIRS